MGSYRYSYRSKAPYIANVAMSVTDLRERPFNRNLSLFSRLQILFDPMRSHARCRDEHLMCTRNEKKL